LAITALVVVSVAGVVSILALARHYQWDGVAEWFSAVGTVAAFLAVSTIFGLDARERHRIGRESQPGS